MRTSPIYLILLAFVIGCSTTLPPSQPSKKIVDQADTIILSVDDSADDAFTNFSRYLLDYGFRMQESDSTRRYLKTALKRSQYYDFQYSLNTSVMETDSTTIIQVNGMAYNRTFGDIKPENWGMDQTLNVKAWKQIRAVVEAYPHRELFYKRM